MNPTKVIALFLGLTSLAGLLFLGLMAAVGPYLVPESVKPPGSELSLGCFNLIVAACLAPFAAVPGIAGLGLWRFVIRQQEATAGSEPADLPEREVSFQARLDSLTRRLVDCNGEAAVLTAELPLWTRDLDGPLQSRLLCLLAECGSAPWGPSFLPMRGSEAGTGSSGWGARALSLGCFTFAAFCFLWGAMLAVSYLTTDLAELAGIGSRVGAAVGGSGGCFIPGLTALLGGLGVHLLIRKETVRTRQLASSRQRAREITLESCLRRIERLLHGDDGAAPPPEPIASRIVRAHVICALPELDGTGKGRLISGLQAAGFLARLHLGRADLRGADLAGIDLSAAALAGADLSGAQLRGALLLQADLHGCRLQGVDLRRADASGANLRKADLRQALMHQCRLYQADLRGANLAGANLWQADLAGAQLDDGLNRAQVARS